MNPLFGQIGNMMQGNNMMQMIQQIMQFKNTFRGDPRTQVQQLLNSGKVSQEQYNNAMQLANQLQSIMGKM